MLSCVCSCVCLCLCCCVLCWCVEYVSVCYCLGLLCFSYICFDFVLLRCAWCVVLCSGLVLVFVLALFGVGYCVIVVVVFRLVLV